MAVSTTSCGTGIHTTFRATDSQHHAVPGPAPQIFWATDGDGAVPRATMHSVGVIEITASPQHDRASIARAAAERGQRLGCWILVEHSLFEQVQSKRALAFGAQVFLAHGTAPHVGAGPRPPRRIELDCVLRGEPAQRT